MLRITEELWKFRLLVYALVARHLRARYRGSILGFMWSFLNPLCLIAVYSLVFKYYIRFDEVEHYTVFMFVGLLPWIWFSSGLIESTSSISSGGSLITKAIFPAHILPVVSVITNLVHFLLALPLLFILMIISGISIGAEIVLLPLIIFLQLLFMIGISLTLSSLNVYYRDIQHILGNLITLWFFLCPIIYPASSVPERFKLTLILNPMAQLIEMYHQLLLGGEIPSLKAICLLAGLSFVLIWAGSWIFNRYRDQFAESI
ncbi:MAG TPA: ABC transporter permease [Oligoflexia bacterium]|nr:ABC transporter permease [Oligoflexia bacterium]HMP49539.1 ABC transporter permease [Oligoflexia bacterium]